MIYVLIARITIREMRFTSNPQNLTAIYTFRIAGIESVLPSLPRVMLLIVAVIVLHMNNQLEITQAITPTILVCMLAIVVVMDFIVVATWEGSLLSMGWMWP